MEPSFSPFTVSPINRNCHTNIFFTFFHYSINYCRASHPGDAPRVAVVAQNVARLLCCCCCCCCWCCCCCGCGWLVGWLVLLLSPLIFMITIIVYIYTSICTSHITSPSLQYFSQSQAVFLWTDSGSCSGCVYFMPSPRISCCRV